MKNTKKMFIILLIIIIILSSIIFYMDNSTGLKKIPILMYHSVDEKHELNKIRIRPDRFEYDLIYLKDKGYETINFDQLIKYKEEGIKLPEKPIIITFDDGYLNNYEYAYPLLKKYNMKASIFLIASRAGINSFNGDDKYTYLDWIHAKEMISSGFIDVYPHSYILHNYDKSKSHGQGMNRAIDESYEDYYDRLKKDTLKVNEIFEEKLGYTPNVYAYPYGNYTHVSDQVLKDLGYKVTLDTKSKIGDINNGLYLLKRFNIGDHLQLKKFIK